MWWRSALVWSAVLNGIVAVPVMALLMLISRRQQIMGPFRVSLPWTIIGWTATAVMAIAATSFIVVSLA
jgi:Mn2+/Fe2+ NRAMP family transporter